MPPQQPRPDGAGSPDGGGQDHGESDTNVSVDVKGGVGEINLKVV